MRFDEILTNEAVLDALYDMHFDECTPIQELAIPIISQGRDLIGIAQTGTGKTAAYLLPVIDKLSEEGYPTDAINCLVLAPTRELAQQIDQQMEGFAYFMPVSSMAIYGGTNGEGYGRQQRGLKEGADVVIATPGRLLAHLSMGYVDLSRVAFLILDEADRMLDMGFYDDIMQIVSRLPKERQTLMFSATMPPKIRKLAEAILRDPAEIRLAVSKPAEKIRQEVALCNEGSKLPMLMDILSKDPFERVIIFASSKLKVKQLGAELRKKAKAINANVGIMHSDLEQSERDETMLAFRGKKVKVLVATDIVARGIDIDDITMVINYDVPHDPEDYVHRVGRTARADKDGRAVTFVTDREKRKLAQLERFLGKKITRISSDTKSEQKEQKPQKEQKRHNRHKGHEPQQASNDQPQPTDPKPQMRKRRPPHKRHKKHNPNTSPNQQPNNPSNAPTQPQE